MYGVKYDSTAARINAVRQITMQHYEPENIAKCYKAIWRKFIRPQFGICYRTYLNYIGQPRPQRAVPVSRLKD